MISYARRDGSAIVKRFYDDLCARLKVIRPELGDSPVFMDTADIQIGESWPPALAEQLRSAPILIPIYSPSFFASEECGREVRVFLQRLERIHGGPSTPLPRCILPVIWIKKNLTVPAALRHIQYDTGGLPTDYLQHGLERLLRLRDSEPEYQRFVYSFADQLSDAATLPPLPVLANLDYHSVQSAWTLSSPSLERASVATGPNVVQFVFIAASANELMAHRQGLDAYGSDGREWKTFHPPLSRSIGLIVPGIAADEGFFYETIPFDEHLLERLRESERARKIVVLVVDSWVALLPKYRELLEQFDQYNYRNCSVLIPLNTSDPETQARRGDLLAAISSTLFSYADRRPDSPYFRVGISKYDEFDVHLRKVLAAIKSDILTRTQVRGPGDYGLSRSLPTF